MARNTGYTMLKVRKSPHLWIDHRSYHQNPRYFGRKNCGTTGMTKRPGPGGAQAAGVSQLEGGRGMVPAPCFFSAEKNEGLLLDQGTWK